MWLLSVTLPTVFIPRIHFNLMILARQGQPYSSFPSSPALAWGTAASFQGGDGQSEER